MQCITERQEPAEDSGLSIDRHTPPPSPSVGRNSTQKNRWQTRLHHLLRLRVPPLHQVRRHLLGGQGFEGRQRRHGHREAGGRRHRRLRCNFRC